MSDRNRKIRLLAISVCLSLFGTKLEVCWCEEPREVRPQPNEMDVPVIFNEAVALDTRREDWVRAAILEGRSETWSRLQAERLLTQRVTQLGTECQLTPEQSSKLLLAGRGDIANYFRDIESLSRELIPQAAKEGLNNFIVQPEIQAKLEPLKQRWKKGLHVSGSFYQGVLKQTLSEEQIRNIDTQRRQKSELRTKQQLMILIVNIEKSVPLNMSQRNALMKKLEPIITSIKETRNAKIGPATQTSNYETIVDIGISETNEDRFLPLVAAMKLTEADLKSFLDIEQVTAMVALQRHWQLNVPLLNAEEGSK